MEIYKRILCLLISVVALITSVAGQKKSNKDSIFGSKINNIVYKQLKNFDNEVRKQNPGRVQTIVHLVFYQYNLDKKSVVFSIVEILDSGDLEKFTPKKCYVNSDLIAIVKFPSMPCDSLLYLNTKDIDASTMQNITSKFSSDIMVNGEPYAYFVEIKNKRVKIKKAICYSIDNPYLYEKHNF